MKRIYARNCEIKEITNKEANDFFGMYHKQGALTTSIAAFGLFYNGELIQAESFGLPRIEMQAKSIWHDWELYRECSKEDYYVIGGKSKLLKAFENKYKPLALLSYCNTTLGFDGHSYKACGFKLERTSDDYYYEYNGDIIKRYKMQKNSNLRKQGKVEPIQRTLEHYGLKYDPNKTEKENAEAAGFKRVNGTGQQVWTKLYSKDVAYIYDFELNGKHYIGQHTLYKNGVLTGRTDYIGSGTYWLNAVNKYGKKSVTKNIICWTTNLNNLSKLEYECIIEAVNKYGKENMYNLAYQRQDHYNKQQCNVHSNHKYYLSHPGPNTDKIMPVETKIKISEALVGKPLSEETKLKIKEAMNKPEVHQKLVDNTKEMWDKGVFKYPTHLMTKESREKQRKSLREHNSKLSPEERQKKYGSHDYSFLQTDEYKAKMKEAVSNGKLKQDKLDYYKYKADGGDLSWNQWRKAHKEGKV